MILLTLLCIESAIYLALIAWITWGLFRIPKALSQEQSPVSVIVAARNEEENIAELLESLCVQDYPPEKYEVIIVDDGSTDSTALIISDFINHHPERQIKLLRSQNRETVVSPKKNAIGQGINAASGEIILLTDADCIVPPGWITGLVQRFDPETGMVIGFSPYERPSIKSLPSRFLALDALSLAAIAAGTSGWGMPATCNGRNLGYRQAVFQQVGGFEKIKQFASGDDDLFLKLVLKYTDWKIRYVLDASLAVPTLMLSNIRQFFHQRMRHASKGLHYEPAKILLLIVVYLYNLLLIAAILSLIVGQSLWLLLPLAIKFVADFILLFTFATYMHKRSYLSIFPLASIVHLFYVTIFGALGQLKWFKWKEK